MLNDDFIRWLITTVIKKENLFLILIKLIKHLPVLIDRDMNKFLNFLKLKM